MARNEEKANATLNRWLAVKQQERLGFHAERPRKTRDVTTISEAEKWRGELVREISQKVTKIQNAFLGESRVRELNDEINELVWEKNSWDRRILELGGTVRRSDVDLRPQQDGGARGGSRGTRGRGGSRVYRYYGVAKDLLKKREEGETHVLDVLEGEGEPEVVAGGGGGGGAHTKRVPVEYFGFHDEESGDMLEAEREAEKEVVERAMREWEERVEEQKATIGGSDFSSDLREEEIFEPSEIVVALEKLSSQPT